MESSAYREQLNRWSVVQLTRSTTTNEPHSLQLPPQQWQVIARFRTWSDAEGHLQLLMQKMPDAKLKVVFDVKHTPLESTES